MLVDNDEELVLLDLDAAEDLPARHRPRQRWLWLLLAAVLVGGLIVQANRHTPAAAPNAQRSRSAAPSGITAAPETPSTAPVTVTRLAHPLLGQTGSWTLFGRGGRALVRIDLARSEITRTVIPALQSSGPVYFVPAAGEVIIRPLDFVASYAVPDGRPVQPLPASFGPGGPIFPGPDPGHVWVASADELDPTVVLTSLDGHPTGTVIRLQDPGDSQVAVGDGAGYLLVTTSEGVYRAQPGQLRRLSNGPLLATGPTGWLVTECDRQGHCQRVLIDRTSYRRRVLGPEIANSHRPPWGAISPDGGTAAIFDLGFDGLETIELLDLHTGSLRPTGLHLQREYDDSTIRWSPDGSWLFAIDLEGGLDVLTLATGQIRSLPVTLSPLTQLAVRPD